MEGNYKQSDFDNFRCPECGGKLIMNLAQYVVRMMIGLQKMVKLKNFLILRMGEIKMSKYVMSDIHGCYEKFISMLKLINFTNNDELYIIGDIFDRGPEPIKVLDYVVGHKNITLLKGNHEKMFEEAIETGDYNLWYCNGGQITHCSLLKEGLDKELMIYNYIRMSTLRCPFIYKNK